MLTAAFPKLNQTAFARCLNAFFRSAAYPAIIVAAMVLSATMSLELAVFYFYFAVGALAVLFAEDSIALFPIVCCGYFAISPENNPFIHPQDNIFTDPAFLVQFIFILGGGALLLTGRAASSLFLGGKGRMPRLTLGLLAFGLSLLLGGAFTSYYSMRSALYSAVLLACLLLPYLFFLLTVDWSHTAKWYLPLLFTFIGVGILVEIADMYTLQGVFNAAGEVNRENLYAGWGTYNNVGCIMAMCVPAPCYFAATRKNGWAYLLLSGVFLLGVLFTQSRASILFGVIVFAACAMFVLYSSKNGARWKCFFVYLAMIFAVAAAYLVFRKEAERLFASLLRVELSSSGRIGIYKNCWNIFLKHPVFGVGFYATPGYAQPSVGSFMPPRAHDTYLQLLATGGVVAFAAYFLHRAETLSLLLRRRSPEKAFVALVLLALILTSILDCHFFNLGPDILYGALLAFAEGTEASD